MAVYTPISRDQMEEILLSYNIGNLWNFKSIEKGLANTVYFLTTTKGEFILTVFDQKEANNVRQNAILMDQLHDSNICIPEIITTKEGEPFVFFKDKPVVIRSFIEGLTTPQPNLHILEELGELLGKIHSTHVPPGMEFKMPYDPSHFLEVNRIDSYFGSWVIDKIKHLQQQIPDKAPVGLIHGDLFPDNFLVYNNKITGIIDFEETCEYYLAFDLAIALIGNTRVGSEFDIERVKCLLKGYEKIRKVTELEIKYFHLFITCAATVLAFWRFRQFNILHPNEKYKSSHLELMQVADNFEGSFAYEYIKKYFDR